MKTTLRDVGEDIVSILSKSFTQILEITFYMIVFCETVVVQTSQKI